MTVWLLFVFIGNGWGGGYLKEITSFPTEQSCQASGKIMYNRVAHVTSFVCIQKEQQPK